MIFGTHSPLPTHPIHHTRRKACLSLHACVRARAGVGIYACARVRACVRACMCACVHGACAVQAPHHLDDAAFVRNARVMIEDACIEPVRAKNGHTIDLYPR